MATQNCDEQPPDDHDGRQSRDRSLPGTNQYRRTNEERREADRHAPLDGGWGGKKGQVGLRRL